MLDDKLDLGELYATEPPSPGFLACYAEAEEGWLGDPETPSLFLGAAADDVLVYCRLSDVPEDDLELELLSAVPDVGRREGYATWLEHELGENDLGHILDVGTTGLDEMEAWALEHGVCPGQWFVLWLVPHYERYTSTEWMGYEYDFHCSYHLVSAERLSPAEHLARWERHLAAHQPVES